MSPAALFLTTTLTLVTATASEPSSLCMCRLSSLLDCQQKETRDLAPTHGVYLLCLPCLNIELLPRHSSSLWRLPHPLLSSLWPLEGELYVRDHPVQLCRLCTAQLYGPIHVDHMRNDPVSHSGPGLCWGLFKEFY